MNTWKERVSYRLQILAIKAFKNESEDKDDKDEEDRAILKALLGVTGIVYEWMNNSNIEGIIINNKVQNPHIIQVDE